MGHIVDGIKENPINDDKLIIKDSEDYNKYKEISFAKIKASNGYGDMQKEFYDPDLIGDDVFDMDNMKEGLINLILTQQERNRLSNVLPGVLENKNYISKIDNTYISISAGSALIRKTDGTIHEVSWEATASLDVSSINSDIPWVTYKWNSEETDIELEILNYFPSTFKELEEIALIGRLTYISGELIVLDRHILLSDDPYVSRTQAYKYPAVNFNLLLSYSDIDANYLKISSGELLRWPIVELGTGRHIFEYNGNDKIVYMWGHLQGQTTKDEITDGGTDDQFDIAAIADWYDNNGVATIVPPNKFAAHMICAYAESNIIVLIRGQFIYDTLDDAKSLIQSDTFTEADWLRDRQVAKIGWIIAVSGARDFSVETDAAFVPFCYSK